MGRVRRAPYVFDERARGESGGVAGRSRAAPGALSGARGDDEKGAQRPSLLCWRRRTVVVFGHTGVLLDDVELRGEVVHPLRYENGMGQIARRRALRSFAGPGALVRRKGTGNRDTRDALAFDPSVRGVFSAIAHRVPERLHQVRVERVVASEPGGHVIVTRHPRRPSPGNRAARLARTPDPVALLSSRRSLFSDCVSSVCIS